MLPDGEELGTRCPLLSFALVLCGWFSLQMGPKGQDLNYASSLGLLGDQELSEEQEDNVRQGKDQHRVGEGQREGLETGFLSREASGATSGAAWGPDASPGCREWSGREDTGRPRVSGESARMQLALFSCTGVGNQGIIHSPWALHNF